MNTLRDVPRLAWQTAPLLPVAAGIVGGIIVDRAFALGYWTYLAGMLVVSALASWSRFRVVAAPLLLVAAGVCVGGARHHGEAGQLQAQRPLGLGENDRQLVRLRGKVVTEPRLLDPPVNPFQRWTYGKERSAFLFDVADTDPQAMRTQANSKTVFRHGARLRVTVDEPVLDLEMGEEVELFGWLHSLRAPSNPGAFDWSEFYRRQGITARLYCHHRENVQRMPVARNETNSVRDRYDLRKSTTWVTRLRRTVRAWLTDDLIDGAEEEASLLEAMILGHRSRLDRRLNELFVRAGCIHFLAVSGTHVVIVLSVVWLIGRFVLRSKRKCAWLLIIAAVLYALIAEPRPPILRATIMAVLYCTSLILGRAHSHTNWIAGAAIVLLIVRPLNLFDVGFQLSFSAVMGVTFITPALLGLAAALRDRWRGDLRAMKPGVARRAHGHPANQFKLTASIIVRHARTWLFTLFAVSIGAWLAGWPIVATHFNRVQPWAPLNSVLIFPLVYGVMLAGLVKLAVGSVSPSLGVVLAAPLLGIERWLVSSVEVLATLPGSSMPMPSPPSWLAVLYYLFLTAFGLAFARRVGVSSGGNQGDPCMRQEHVRICRGAVLVLLVVLILSVGVWQTARRADRELRMTMLAVGAGTAAVIELPEGQTVLYDVGSASPVDVGRHVVVPFLRHRGISRIDEVYLSHPNLDHFSGLPSVLSDVKVGTIIINPYFKQRATARSPSRYLLDWLGKQERQLRTHPSDLVGEPASLAWDFGGATFEHLSPIGPIDDSLITNDTSTVLRVTYQNRSILLAGDIEERTQRALLERGGLEADVLVLPHHGSVRPSSPTFFDAVGADVHIRSSQQRLADTMNGLQEMVAPSTLYNTADVGAVTVTIRGGSLQVNATRKGRRETGRFEH